MIIYLIRNTQNHKCYVGKTKRSLQQRWHEHVYASHKSNLILARAIRKYGRDAFVVSILDTCFSEDELNALERFWIEKLSTYKDGYNMTRGGDGVCGWRPSLEHRLKISAAHLGPKNHNFGKRWGRKGPMSDETKHKISVAHKGLKHSNDAKCKISRALAKRVRKTHSVFQYTHDGIFIAKFASSRQAAQSINGHEARIGDCCRGNRKSHMGYKWSYIDNCER
jgi:group I intron endonuclease